MMGDLGTLFGFFIVSIGFGLVALVAAWLFRPSVADPIKTTTYECGIEATGTTEVKTNIRFYVYALIFVIFEVETLYVYPWAVEVKAMGGLAILEMFIFLGVLLLGLVYAWRKGALVWE